MIICSLFYATSSQRLPASRNANNHFITCNGICSIILLRFVRCAKRWCLFIRSFGKLSPKNVGQEKSARKFQIISESIQEDTCNRAHQTHAASAQGNGWMQHQSIYSLSCIFFMCGEIQTDNNMDTLQGCINCPWETYVWLPISYVHRSQLGITLDQTWGGGKVWTGLHLLWMLWNEPPCRLHHQYMSQNKG